MWVWAKRFLSVAALALQSLVVVVLWTRFFDQRLITPNQVRLLPQSTGLDLVGGNLCKL